MYTDTKTFHFWGFPLMDLEGKDLRGIIASLFGGGALALLGKELIKRWRPTKDTEIEAGERFLETVLGRVTELQNRLDQFQADHWKTMRDVHAEYEARIALLQAELNTCRSECQKFASEAIKRGYVPEGE